METRSQLFRKEHRTQNVLRWFFAGGLGLALVTAIQKLHDEDYGVENHPDGVEFWFEEKIYT